jgi:hypothetical protein
VYDGAMSRSPADIEKIKLTASFLNALSSGTILAAIVAPYIGMGMGTLVPQSNLWNLLGLSGFGFAAGIVLHLIARRSLTQMED